MIAADLRSKILLRTVGYAVLANSLTAEACELLAARAADQARAEAEAGVGTAVVGNRQTVLTLMNKGSEFVQLLLQEDVNALLRHVIGEEFQLSSATASVPVGDTQSGDEELGITQW